ncbi:hypothetical protein N9N28_15495, partial [Rubripirellula amarantea]|nr:hypothetical protein [Rubripirellula amarantea]
VYETAEPESLGTFSDIELVRSLTDEWELVTGLAIATEEAASKMSDHGHPEDAETLVRAFYLALALNELGYDLEHYLPGMPVHALGR